MTEWDDGTVNHTASKEWNAGEESPLDPVPICLPCWRERFGLEAQVPPALLPRTTESCHICHRPTTAGLYLLRGRTVNREGKL